MWELCELYKNLQKKKKLNLPILYSNCVWKNICLWWLELKYVVTTEKHAYLLFFYICSESIKSQLSITLPFSKVFIWFSLPSGLNGQAGKLPLWNVPTDILQSWKWVFFSSLHFYSHSLFHGLCWEEIPSGGLILFGLFVLGLPKQFLAIKQCIEKAHHVLGQPWISLGRAGWGDTGTPGKMCQWRRSISQLLTLLIRCAEPGLENLQ